ncbi:hypothetical protein AB0M47_27755 [Hamadaea sp. NPDC051192]|uniref:hypothetical protein n=1 Tax=Hamadaea sp. NPDC051192 TaxID=3154940 RepID=UPI00343C8A8C
MPMNLATGRRPALAAAAYVGLFCLIAAIAVLWSVLRGSSWSEQAVVSLSIGLRLFSIGIALASVHRWGDRLPGWLVLAGLWGAAAVQLLYPLAETVVKTLILTGVMEPMNKGISNMSADGWFNFGAMWVIWGVPGVLFLLAALAYRVRRPAPWAWVLLGVVGGAALLFGLGLLIG